MIEINIQEWLNAVNKFNILANVSGIVFIIIMIIMIGYICAAISLNFDEFVKRSFIVMGFLCLIALIVATGLPEKIYPVETFEEYIISALRKEGVADSAILSDIEYNESWFREMDLPKDGSYEIILIKQNIPREYVLMIKESNAIIIPIENTYE